MWIVEQAAGSYTTHQLAEFSTQAAALEFINSYTPNDYMYSHRTLDRASLYVIHDERVEMYYAVRGAWGHVGKTLATFNTYTDAERFLSRYSNVSYPNGYRKHGPLYQATTSGITRTSVKSNNHNPELTPYKDIKEDPYESPTNTSQQ